MAKRKPAEPAEPIVGLDVLDDLIKSSYEKLKVSMEQEPKLGDLIKMIELRHKLTPSASAQKEFWKMLDRIRGKALPDKWGTSIQPEKAGAGQSR